jgi:hypothetical protein
MSRANRELQIAMRETLPTVRALQPAGRRMVAGKGNGWTYLPILPIEGPL